MVNHLEGSNEKTFTHFCGGIGLRCAVIGPG
jgi:hypothetical protein